MLQVDGLSVVPAQLDQHSRTAVVRLPQTHRRLDQLDSAAAGLLLGALKLVRRNNNKFYVRNNKILSTLIVSIVCR